MALGHGFCDHPAEVEIHLPQEFRALAESSSLTDLLVDEEVLVSGPSPLGVPIGALSARILRGP